MTDRRKDPETFLPLTAAEYHVLLALGNDALHGYGMMQALEDKTDGRDALLPGSLYTTLARMVEKGLLEELSEPPDPDADRRRRYYRAPRAGGGAGGIGSTGPASERGRGGEPRAGGMMEKRGTARGPNRTPRR